MLVAVVREAGQVVLSDGEVLDAWSVILNGTVEVSMLFRRSHLFLIMPSFLLLRQ
ncbi:unnamed protein product [Dibothriocephalus latus]|uniref:Cyclic nucleotide-binding domain-containing protein n=1 Tax=Dibothriocephalus latus TaxID=60516 RepID=A0A3P7ND09_DIBLA|nr:unnamed protein product [Dibothriocephalus latus]